MVDAENSSRGHFDYVAPPPILQDQGECCIGGILLDRLTDPGKVVGIVTRSDLLKARAKVVEEEVRREGMLTA
jgi:hypothetical protein